MKGLYCYENNMNVNICQIFLDSDFYLQLCKGKYSIHKINDHEQKNGFKKIGPTKR